MTSLVRQADPPLPSDAVPCRMPGVSVEHFESESMLLDEATAFVCSLNPTAAAVWSWANGRRSIAAIAGKLAEVTQADPVTAQRDVAHFVAELRRQGFVRLIDDPADARGFAERLQTLLIAIAQAQQAWEQEIGRETAMRLTSDASALYAPLAALRRYAGSLLDLGHGLGAATMLASLLGYRAIGIEIDPRLHARSIALADELALAPTLLHGSFLPSDFAPASVPADHPAWAAYRSDAADPGDAEALTSLDLPAIDLWLATPLRDAEAVTTALFDTYAADHAILATYLGSGPTVLRDKAGRELRYYGSEDDAALARWFGRDVPDA